MIISAFCSMKACSCGVVQPNGWFFNVNSVSGWTTCERFGKKCRWYKKKLRSRLRERKVVKSDDSSVIGHCFGTVLSPASRSFLEAYFRWIQRSLKVQVMWAIECMKSSTNVVRSLHRARPDSNHWPDLRWWSIGRHAGRLWYRQSSKRVSIFTVLLLSFL